VLGFFLIAGLAILLAWEGVVRAWAPAYVAKPSGVIAAIPAVIVRPDFLVATAQTLLAVAEGLAIAIAVGNESAPGPTRPWCASSRNRTGIPRRVS